VGGFQTAGLSYRAMPTDSPPNGASEPIVTANERTRSKVTSVDAGGVYDAGDVGSHSYVYVVQAEVRFSITSDPVTHITMRYHTGIAPPLDP